MAAGGRSPRESRRRAVVLAGHAGDDQLARAHLDDADPKVRASALGALARAERLTAQDLERAMSDPASGVRRRACELSVAQKAADPTACLSDPEATVVEAAAWAIGERGQNDALEGLAEVAGGHDDPLCREAAVAALGAIGDPRGLPTILAGLDDRTAVRRRAVIALAPFEGNEVEAALRRALNDRDWQVRQAAEDLTDDRRVD